MTNEEKANEIARDMLPYNNAEYHACYNSAMKAMQWKDEQQWKPTEKQLDALLDYVNYSAKEIFMELNSLYEELVKLYYNKR